MKEIEEQIAKLIWLHCQSHECCMMDDKTKITQKILSEVTIEIKCPDFHTGAIKIITDEYGHEVCEICKGVGKTTITLKEAIARVK